MRKSIIKQKKGQFIIIAILFIATMIISIGGMLYTTVTYYKYEPWEEYLTLIGSIELSSERLVELSLSNCTHTNDTSILRTNLGSWQRDLTKIYPGYGVELDLKSVKDPDLIWYNPISFSNASATFSLDISFLGLSGYEFTAISFLNLTIINNPINSSIINATVTREAGNPVFNLKRNNFRLQEDSTVNIVSVTSRYDPNNTLVYIITCDGVISSPVTLSVCDHRGIKVEATY